jgi:4-alpha-glucanotransferase
LLTRAWTNFRKRPRAKLREEFEQFRHEKAQLQEEPALFMALRGKFKGAPFQQWPTELARREPAALKKMKRALAAPIERFLFGQFIILRQWQLLKRYANGLGIQLLGDLPIFVSPDSADVWANPELFLLDEQRLPKVVAGVPPDYFSNEGQLWGNPLYNWGVHREGKYGWWINRLRARLEYLDAIRIDHFRGFEAAWHVPAGASTAQSGEWVPGPGSEFFEQARQSLGGLPLLAEDLGTITPAVTSLREQFHLPGMRVLQFGFNGDPQNPHLPHHCEHNSVVYTGTHDNDTTAGWYESLNEHERWNFLNYVQRQHATAPEAAWELIRLAWNSGAALSIAPLQDLMALGSAARMNVPGRAEGQWRWRFPRQDSVPEKAWHRLYDLTEHSGRVRRPLTSLQIHWGDAMERSPAINQARSTPRGVQRPLSRVVPNAESF